MSFIEVELKYFKSAQKKFCTINIEHIISIDYLIFNTGHDLSKSEANILLSNGTTLKTNERYLELRDRIYELTKS